MRGWASAYSIAQLPKHNPLSPLPDATHEAYLQQRVRGVGPSEAALATGCAKYRDVERRFAFKARLRSLTAPSTFSATIELRELVVKWKQLADAATAANQFKNAATALDKLAELHKRYPALRGDGEASAPAVAAAPEAREDRRARNRALLSAVPAEAAGE